MPTHHLLRGLRYSDVRAWAGGRDLDLRKLGVTALVVDDTDVDEAVAFVDGTSLRLVPAQGSAVVIPSRVALAGAGLLEMDGSGSEAVEETMRTWRSRNPPGSVFVVGARVGAANDPAALEQTFATATAAWKQSARRA